jgi:thiamine biosynthesis lipoprotein
MRGSGTYPTDPSAIRASQEGLPLLSYEGRRDHCQSLPVSSPPPPRPPFRRRPPVRRRSRKVFFLLTPLALLVAGLWFFVLRAPLPGYNHADFSTTSTEQKRYQEERPLMGTSFGIVVYATSEEKAQAAIEAAFARASEIERICTDYDPTSELSLLSSEPVGKPISVSQTLATVLAHASVTAEITEGAYDPTIGPLSRLWRRSRKDSSLPAGNELASAMTRTGWQHLKVDVTKRTVTLDRAHMRLDLGGIAKGFAADEMYTVLLDHGLPSAFIAAGGDIRLGHPPPGETTWKVGLRTLGPDTEDFIRVANCAVSTSGDLHQFIEIDGTRYSHILDPTTGLGLTRRIAATVIAPLAIQSDPYATFACILPDVAFSSFDSGGISVRIVTERDATRRDQSTSNFPEIESL